MFSVHAVMLLGALAGARPPPPPAPPPGPRSMVLLVDGTGLSPAGQQAVAAALKKEVVRSAGYAWQDPPPISVDELVLALSCKKLDVDCLVKMSDVLKADAVVVVSLANKGKEMQLLMVQFRPERAIHKTGVAFKGEDGLPQNLAASARGLLGPLRPTVLDVETAPPGATVSLDGALLGKAPVTFAGVTSGPHTLEARLDGHVSAQQPVDISPGETTHVTLQLAPVPVLVPAPEPVAQPPPAPPEPEPVASSPGPAFWVAPARYALLGTGVLAGALGALVMAGSMVPVAAYGAAWALATVLSVQRAISVGRLLLLPSLAGGMGAGAGLLLVPVALGLLGGGLILGWVRG